MTVKSSVLTKANFNASSLNGKKIIGRIQSGNPDYSIPLSNAWLNIYQSTPVPVGTPGTALLTDIGFYESTVNHGVNLGVEHFNAVPQDFKDINVVVNYEGNPTTPTPEVDFGFCTATMVDLDSSIKAIRVTITNAELITETKNLFFAVTYSCDPTSDHYHVVWARLTIDPTQPDPMNWVQVMWYTENQ